MGLTTVSFKIDRETLEVLKVYSQNKGVPKSAVIREAIEELIREGIKTKPRKIWGNSVMFDIRIDPELLKQLDDFAKKNKMSRSLAIRTAIYQYLQKFVSFEVAPTG